MVAERAVSCSGLVQIYATEESVVQALRGVDLEVRSGSVTAIVGPSGGGKTSLLRLLSGLDTPSAGEVVVGGTVISQLSRRRRRAARRQSIGYVHQRPTDNLLSGVPIGSQLRGFARHRGARRDDVEVLLEQLGIAHRIDNEPGQLSGGEQQRAGIARALLGGPAVVIADEPTAELDRSATADVCALLRELATDRDVAVVIATHDIDVMAAADHVVLLRDGAIQSETIAGQVRSVIDSAGRVQLPPDVLAWFPDRRVLLDLETDRRVVHMSEP